MDIKAKVHEVSDVINVSDSFKKRELILEFAENPQYPEYIKLEAHQDKTGLLDTVKPGDSVEVFFNLRGRPWTNKEGVTTYFNSLVVWRINVLEKGAAPVYAAPVDISSSDDDDDLPF